MTETDMEGYRDALTVAVRALSDHPRAALTIRGNASSNGDIAAHLVAYAAIQRRRERPERAVERHLEAGVEAIARLSLLTDDPDPAQWDVPAIAAVKGRVGKDWSYSSGFLHHYGRDWHLSGVMRGVFPVLPALQPDLEEMERRFKNALRDTGLPDDVVKRAVARAGTNPYGQRDDRPWTEFALPMDDGRIDYANSIVELGHKAGFITDDSLRAYALQACTVHEHRDSLSRMADAVEELCHEAGDEVPTLRLKGISINSISINRVGRLKDSVVMHACLTGLSEALTEIDVKGIFTGPIGLNRPTTSNLFDLVKAQTRRFRTLAKLGGTTVERTGMALLRAAGHDVDAMLTRLRDDLETTDTRVHAGRGTKAWMRISGGRVTATVDITPEARWKHDHLEIRRTLPESVLSSAEGRAATDLVGHPALEGARVRSARTLRGRTIVAIEPRWDKFG